MTDYRAMTRAAAEAAGIDADVFERQIDLESAGFAIDVIECRRDSPAGARGIAQIMPQFHPGVDPCDPPAALKYAAELMAGYIRTYGDWFHALIAYNWGSGNLIRWSGQWSDLPHETQKYLEIILGATTVPDGDSTQPAPVYDPTTPQQQQDDPWSCSCVSTWWGLTAYGRHPTETWVESQMLADGIVSTEQGLLDASGATLAQWITDQYGEFGYSGHNNARVSFDDVARLVGSEPVLIGGRAWNHWSGARRYDAAHDWIELANPADGWMNVQQTMTRQQFDALGPFSCVLIHWGGAEAPPATPDPPAPVEGVAALKARIADLEGQVAALQSEKDGLVIALADVSDRIGDAIYGYAEALKGQVEQMRNERQQFIGPRA